MIKQIWPEIGSMVTKAQEFELRGIKKRLDVLNRVRINRISNNIKVEEVVEMHHGFEYMTKKKVPADTSELDAKIQIAENKLTSLNTFASQANELAVGLAKFGLTAVAYVPTKLFCQLCRKFGIWRFEHLDGSSKTKTDSFDRNGWFDFVFGLSLPFIIAESVAFAAVLYGAWLPILAVLAGYFFLSMAVVVGKAVPVASMAGKVAKVIGIIALIQASFVSLYMVGYAIKPVWFTFMSAESDLVLDINSIIQLIIQLFVLVIFGFIGLIGFEKKKRLYAAKWYGKYLSRLPRKQQLKKLFPRMVDDDADGQKITVKFIQAPAFFLEALFRLEKQTPDLILRPMVAATPEAVILDSDEVERVGTNLAYDALGEPILYSTLGEATAIVSSFGEFPNEQEIMDWIKKEGLKLCFN